MRRAVRPVKVILRFLPVMVALAIALPTAGVHPTTLTLTKVETAQGYDAGPDVVWVLVLGSDSIGDTDAIQLLGIDVRTGAAAAIGFPRDSWVDLGNGQMGKINAAYKYGGAALASTVVQHLVGISPDYVLLTAGDGFVSMVDALGGVTVDSPRPFVTDDDHMQVEKGPNRFTGHQALDFVMTREAFTGPGDFTRSRNEQRLLIGLLKELQKRDDHKGFVEMMALSALQGLETNASPVDLYRLLNALTGVDPAKVKGCLLTGPEDTVGSLQIIRPNRKLGERLGREVVDDATFESGCRPG
jgi:polyisoprenyl-teichoic acid--peptidoglycan teichoic acid transferase